MERRKLALAVQQVSGFCPASASLRQCQDVERLLFASPLVMYSVSELLCSPSVVKTVNTGVTQRINGNDMRVVLVDNQCFSPHPLQPHWAGRDDVREQLPINMFTGLGPDCALEPFLPPALWFSRLGGALMSWAGPAILSFGWAIQVCARLLVQGCCRPLEAPVLA